QLEAGQPEAGSLQLGRRRKLAGRAPQLLEAGLACPLEHALDESAPLLVLGLPELEAEEALDEAVALGGLPPAAANGLGDHVVGRDQPAADDVEDMVDIAHDWHGEGLD